MRKVFPVAVFVVVLLLLAMVGTLFVGLAEANGIFVPPDNVTEPPTFKIFSKTVNGNNVTINLKATVGKSITAVASMIEAVYYEMDWTQSRIYVYRYYNFDENLNSVISDTERRTEVSCNLNETAIPDGNHTITIYALEGGRYKSDATFHITGSYSVNFTIDTVAPSVSVLSLEGVTYNVVDVPLNFTVSEPASKLSYVLDDQGNATVDGNTTLSGLSAGEHTVKVYAWDAAGNVGASETVTFTIELFPAVPVAAASVAVVASVSAGVIVYFKKRER